MNLTRRQTLALSAAAFAGLAPRTAFAGPLDDIKARKSIRIAVDIGAPPYGMVDGNAQQIGSDIETAKLLAADLGVALEIVPVTGPSRVPFLLSGRVDLVIASFSITDERKKVIDFSKPYAAVPVVVAGPAKAAIKSFADLAGKSIAVTRGTTSDQQLTRGARDIGNVTIVRYEDDATTNTAVASGQQDYLAAAPSVIPEVKKANASRDIEVKFVMTSFPCGIGIRKEQADLKVWVDEWVVANLKNGKLNTIYRKYFNVDLPSEIVGG